MKNFLIKNKINIAILVFVLVVVNLTYNYFRYGSMIVSQDYYREIYKQARDLQDDEEYESAYAAYSKIPSAYSAYDAVLFNEAKCAVEIGDEKRVITRLKQLIKRSSSGLLAPQANYNLGQAYVRTGERDAAIKIFNKIIDKFPDSDYATASYYYLGSLNKTKNINEAVKYWNKYISLAADGRFSQDCADEIISSKVKLDEDTRLNLGRVLYSAQMYGRAISFLETVSLKKSWYYRAKAYQNASNNPKAILLIKQGLQKYSANFEKEQIHDAMTVYVELNSAPAVNSWNDLINITASSNLQYRDFALYKKALLLPEDSAKDLYKGIIKYYPGGDFASEALWRLFWAEYTERNYQQAFKLGNRYLKNYSDNNAAPAMTFWMGKLCERTGKRSAAQSYYGKVIRSYPDTYYAFRANGRKLALNTGVDPGWKTNFDSSIRKADYEAELPYSGFEIEQRFGSTMLELIKAEDFELVTSLKVKDPFIDSWVNLKEGLKSKSIVMARDGMKEVKVKPSFDDRRWRLVYPLYFVDEISDYSSVNSLDPVIVLSLMREESYFNHLAVSSSNARGLMQLLPGTASDVSRWKGLGYVDTFGLFNPEVNIKFGTAYINYLVGKLGKTVFAVAGYNGGPGAVQGWLNTMPNSDLDEFIENIPYDQTRDYIKKVYGSYWNYKQIYKF